MQLETYNKKCHFFFRSKNILVIRKLTDLNKRKKCKSVKSFDFSALYTNIHHDKLKFVLNDLTNFCFKGGEKQYIKVLFKWANWVENDSQNSKVYSKADIKAEISFLLDNCYFTFAKLPFRQKIGIPRGSDPAPFMANLFLYYYENKWLKSIKSSNIALARKFSNMFRFIDDLLVVNDDDEFSKFIKNIYPPELKLTKENGNSNSTSFLDLQISIDSNRFVTSLYCKRDDDDDDDLFLWYG